MADETDYHGRLREITQYKYSYPEGMEPVDVVHRALLRGAVAEYEQQGHELEEAERVNRVLNANLQSLGEQVMTLRAQLDGERGELIALEITGRAVLSERDIDNLVDRVWAKFDEQQRAADQEDEDDD